ncbi:MAG: hypothetical protein HY907_08740 [Deltaproteobacteria bacterium]|nr:hypothetical protein [Deltaproteobacteria bacterium]
MIDKVAKTRQRRRALVRMALGTAAIGAAGVCTASVGADFLLGCQHRRHSAGSSPDLPPGHFAGWLFTDDLTGPRSPQEILGALRTAAPEFARADWVVVPGAPAPARSVDWRVTVTTDGNVRDARRAGGRTTADPDVVFFLSRMLELHAKFPQADGETEFTVRFVFEPR